MCVCVCVCVCVCWSVRVLECVFLCLSFESSKIFTSIVYIYLNLLIVILLNY